MVIEQRVIKTQEENALAVNLEAADEIARQLRLRDMGGIVVVDFIDMHNPENRKILFDKLKEEMKSDRAKHNILPPSKFGLGSNYSSACAPRDERRCARGLS